MALPFARAAGHCARTSDLQYRGDTSTPRSPRLGRFCRLLLPPGPSRSDDRSLQMSGVALFSGGNLSRGEREDRSNRWVLVAFAIIGLLAASAGLQTGRRSGRSAGIPFAGLVSPSLPPAVPCASGQSLCSAGSAGWSPSSPGIRWSRLVSMALSAASYLRVARQLAGVGPCLSFERRRAAHGAAYPRSSRACARKKHCCAQLWRRIRCVLRTRRG